MKWAVWFIPACFLGIGAVLLVVWLSGGFQGTGLTASIALALALGILFSSLLGVGLMALIFYSNRSGQDEQAHRSASAGMDDRLNDDDSDAPTGISRTDQNG
jgi:hypothetical protein